MRKFKLASILAILTLTFSIAPAAVGCTVTREEPEVYLMPFLRGEGIYYHQFCCEYEGYYANSSIGLYEAQKQGYTACPFCKGIPKGTIEVEYEISGLGCKQSCTDWLIDQNY